MWGIRTFLGIHVARLTFLFRLFDTVMVTFYDGDTIEERTYVVKTSVGAEIGTHV